MSQRLGACGSVASGALRSFLSATYGTPCEKTFDVLDTMTAHSRKCATQGVRQRNENKPYHHNHQKPNTAVRQYRRNGDGGQAESS